MDWIKQVIRFFIVMVVQLLVLNHLQVLGVCHPMVYVFFLLALPITLPSQMDMVVGATVGLIMDIFSNSLGVHMSACTFLMFYRRHLIGELVQDAERLKGDISIYSLGTESFLKYLVLMVPIHHLIVFTLSAWSWSMMGWALLETFVSSFVTMALLYLISSIDNRRNHQ